MEKTQRLVGIDLMKGIAAYSVAVLHAGDVTNSTSVGFWATQMQRFCSFAVPFFLITSFYLLINRMHVTGKSYSLKNRFQRLIIPYAIWSIFFLLMRSAKFLLLHETDGFEKVSDVVSIIFFGAAGLPLYFLPLLFTGTLLLNPLSCLIKKDIKLTPLFLVLLFSITLDYILFATGNNFQLGPNIAFESLVNATLPDGNQMPFVRVALVFTAWLIKCLPFIAAAIIVNHLLTRKNRLNPNSLLMLSSTLAFLIINLLYFLSVKDLNSPIYVDFQPPIYEVTKAIALLVLAICLSLYLPKSRIIASLSLCSFGIYLMHQPVIQIVRIPMGRLFPEFVYNVSISSQLFFASLSFGISWLITSYLVKHKITAKLLFGI